MRYLFVLFIFYSVFSFGNTTENKLKGVCSKRYIEHSVPYNECLKEVFKACLGDSAKVPIEKKRDKYEICKEKTSLNFICKGKSALQGGPCGEAMKQYHKCLNKHQ